MNIPEQFHYQAAEIVGSEPINHPELHRALCGRVAEALFKAARRGEPDWGFCPHCGDWCVPEVHGVAACGEHR